MASKKSEMSSDHKEALARGRTESRTVGNYLEALESSKPKRGRKRTAESIQRRLDKIQVELESADKLRELQLRQERLDLNAELEGMDSGVQLTDLEDEFVKVARDYAERKGISYVAFRDSGVPAAVLKRAGISRSS